MTALAAPQPGARGQERSGPPFDVCVVEDVARLFARAARARQLYLPNNPVYQRSIEQARAAFPPIWELTGELTLVVTESQFQWEGHTVADEPSRLESLPWLVFRDGIRELTFLPGFEVEELERLLDLLQRVRRATPEDDDLLTLLWEQDFLHLRYRFVDVTSTSTPPIEPTPADDRPRVVTTAEEVAPSSALQTSGAPLVRMSDFDSALYFLDEHEIEYVRAAIEAEYRDDLRRNVLSVVLDIFELQPSASVRDEVLEILEQLVVHLLAVGDFTSVAFLVREAQVAAARAGELAGGQRDRLMGAVARLSDPEALGQLLQALDDAPNPPPSEQLNELFDVLQPRALATVLGWLTRLRSARLRAALERATARLAASNVGELVRLLLAGDEDVACEAAHRAGELRTPAAVGPLGKLLAGSTPKLRLAAAQALAEIASTGALQQLERAVDDGDREVRLIALRVLGAKGHRAALPKLEGAVRGKALREADLTEKLAWFEAYGLLAGAAGVAQLDAILNAKGLFGRREDPEFRACAALALGRIGTPPALEALRRAAGEKDVVVRNAVIKAMRQGAP